MVALRGGWRASKHVRHVVTALVAPFGAPAEQRPPVPTEAQRAAERARRRRAKDERQAARGRAPAARRLGVRTSRRAGRARGFVEARREGGGPTRAWESSQRKKRLEEEAVRKEEELEEVTRRFEGLGRVGEEVVLEKQVQAGEIGV